MTTKFFGKSWSEQPSTQIKSDRAILYTKQQLSNLKKELENRTTKTIGESYWQFYHTIRALVPIFQLSGERHVVEHLTEGIEKLNERTLRQDAIKMVAGLLSFVNNYESEIADSENVDDLRSKIEKLEKQLLDGNDKEVDISDISADNAVFVIMPFNKDFNDVWKGGIEKAAKAEGFKPIRIDMLNKSTNITDDIIETIKKCKIAIVDVSSNNPNVMFELGYAMASNKPNIIISQSVEFLPFDIRNIRTIVYNNNWSGIEELRARIQEFLKEFSPRKKSTGSSKNTRR